MSLFKDSIAQANVQFPIETVIEPIAGENYARAVIFMPLSLADSTILPGVVSPAAGTLTILNSNGYGTITGGALKNWLVPFFKSAQSAVIGLAIYDDTDSAESNTIELTYEKFKMYGYFKFGFHTDSTSYNALQVALSNLCAADELYSRLWVGTGDNNVLSGTSALMTALSVTSGSYRVIYNKDTTINPALAQLGKTLSTVNSTGTPVGNSVDMVGFNTIEASGADDADGNATNLTPTQKTSLDNQKVGYNTWVGDGTENVVTEGSLYSDGSSVGAEWVKAYITYMCKVRTANLMSRLNVFRNNETYQKVLLILQDVVKGFVNMGRLANFQITAPVFRDLPTSGDTLTVQNAWQANYIDEVRQVTVYGTLYITQPTR